MKKIIFVLTGFFVLSAVIFAQEYQTPDFLTVKTEKGVMVVNNNKPKPFAFLVAGEEITVKQAGSGLLFFVDGRVLNVAFVDKEAFLKKNQTADVTEILKLHQTWELEFQANDVYKSPIKIDEETSVFLNLPNKDSQETFFWTFTRPKIADSQFNRDCIQSTLIAETVLMLGSPIAPDGKITETRQFFNETLSSLTFLPSQMQTPVNKPVTTIKTTPKTKTVSKPAKRKTKRN